MIELDENDYIIGVWFSSCPTTGNNWMLFIKLNKENPKRYLGAYRIHCLKTGDKFWVDIENTNDRTEDEMIEQADEIQRASACVFPEVDRIIVQGNVKKFLELAKETEWLGIKEFDIKKGLVN